MNSESDDQEQTGQKGGEFRLPPRAKSPYKPRKANSMASRSIPFKPSNFISEAEKIQLQGKTHTPWESEETNPAIGRQVPYLPIMLVSAMFCFAAFLFFRSQELSAPALKSPPNSLTAAADAPEYERRMVNALREFCESGDLAKIKSVIRKADQLGEIVGNYYRGGNPPTNKIIEAKAPSDSIFLSPLEASFLRVVVTFESGIQRDLVIEWVGGEAKIDWEHWVCYNPVSITDFIDPASGSGNEHEFRLMGRLPDQYRSSERFAEVQYGCVVLQDEARGSSDFEAYVLRGTETHQQVMAYLTGDVAKPLIVKLRRYSDNERGGAGIEVLDMVTEGWVREAASDLQPE